jgi:exonuclease SbcD
MHEHQESFVDWLIDTAADLDIELVVIAGDIFDRSVPPQESVALFEKALIGLSALCPVFVTPGNHDSAVRLGYGGTFFAASGVHIQSTTEFIDQPLVITSPDPDIHAAEFGVERSHTAVLTHAMNRIRTDLAHRSAARSMVVSHAFVTGGAGSDSERDLEIGGIGDAPASVFAGVDYTAMGHLHGAQVIGSDSGLIRYSGSPLPYSFGRKAREKCDLD